MTHQIEPNNEQFVVVVKVQLEVDAARHAPLTGIILSFQVISSIIHSPEGSILVIITKSN